MNLTPSKRMAFALVAVLAATAGCSSGSSKSDGGNPGGGTGTGTVVGTVTDSSTKPAAGVIVTVDPAGAEPTTTDSTGKYSLSLPAGTYTLGFSGDNLVSASAGVTVGAGETKTVDQVLARSPLVVTVNLPEALREGGPSGFGTTVEGITATVTLNGAAASADSVAWTIKDSYGLDDPPAPATASPSTGATTSFAVADFETVRQGANAWMNDHYKTAGSEGEFEYIQAPPRDQLLSFSHQQVAAMSYKIVATVTSGSLRSTGSAIVSPVNVSSGGNYQPLGMMVVGDTRPATTYAWTLQFLPMTAIDATFVDPPAGVTLRGADTRNPTLVPTEVGVYKLTNAGQTPIYFRVSTWHGVGKTDDELLPDNVRCSSCHTADDHPLTAKFAAWQGSAHANHNWKDPWAAPMPLVQFGLTGGVGPHYSEECLNCHTVGFSKVPSASNSGFDDVAAAHDWTFPAELGDAAWASVTAIPSLAGRAGVQCESCHGPLEPTDHAQPKSVAYPALADLFKLPLAPAASMDAGICLQCHDELPYHDKGSLWLASAHASTDLPIEDATVEARGTSANHCGRCHAAEGFVVYLQQQQGGNAGTLARPAGLLPAAATCTPGAGYVGPRDPYGPACPCKPTPPASTCTGDPAFYSYLSGLGLNQATAHPQTCQTCHDPHTTELRLSGDTGTVAAGFNYKGAGEGALCMVCHNSRITSPIYADSPKTSFSAPHAASQGDIFAGRNAYFYGLASTGALPDSLPDRAGHAFMSDTCVDCHVKWVPPDVKAQYQPVSTNHTFRTSTQVCLECHEANVAEQVEKGFEEGMTELYNSLAVLFRGKLNKGGFSTVAQAAYTVDADGVPTETAIDLPASGERTVTRIALVEIHGQPGLVVTMSDATVFAAQISKFALTGATLFDASTDANEQIVAKAYYNYLLLHGGAAKGVHNPSFVNRVLQSTLGKIHGVSSL